MSANETQNKEFQQEEKQLFNCLDIIRDNIKMYEKKEASYQKEVTALFQAVRKGEGDSYGQLLTGQSILEATRNSLRKNRAALNKAYFGRIDYDDETYGKKERCYIGKNEVTRNLTEVIIVDWRAPVTSVYYENELGPGTYEVPGSSPIEVVLHKKRTYDINGRQLLGYYDDDTAANDELLVKYLSQHKEAVLGDIIATIQKEQNKIIRDSPFKNIIVQGVAGSGKTTVALHRISYILYNYEKYFKPSEFCIVGSSDMLLNYISSGLPELDVTHVSQMRMDLFIPYLMGKAWKKNYKLIPDRKDADVRSKLSFVIALDHFLKQFEQQKLDLSPIQDPLAGRVFSTDNMEEMRRLNSHLSMLQFEKLLNSRIADRLKSLCSDWEPNERKAKIGQYRKYFHSEKQKWTEPALYINFLKTMNMDTSEVKSGRFDIYDAAALALIYRRILMKKSEDEFSQIIVDEAQDFGEMIYYVLKQLLPGCYFTIMGDVSQNIHFETGMNDWDGLKKALFDSDEDSFCLLSKSYRNTIEISMYAGRVLEKASQGGYKIQPVIRHGQEVTQLLFPQEELPDALLQTLAHLHSKHYETIAIICRDEADVSEVKALLAGSTDPSIRPGSKAEAQSNDQACSGGSQSGAQAGQAHSDNSQSGARAGQFHNGTMVLPVTLTKGLEFDAVILWKPDKQRYSNSQKDAKLLYVAITRALHELYLIGDEDVSGLLA